MKVQSSLRPLLVRSALAALLVSPVLPAADRWWDGGTGNWSGGSSGLTKWSTVSNATTPDPTGAPGINDDLFFNITTANASASTVSFANGARSAKSLTFDTSGSSVFRAGGSSSVNQTLTLGAGGITVNSGAGAVTIGQTPSSYGTINVILSVDQTWTNNGSNTLLIERAVTGSGRSLTTAGTGVIRINGASTYSGSTTVTGGGTLQIGNYAGLDNTSGIMVSGGSTLSLVQVGSGTTSNSIDRTLGLDGFLRTAGGSGTNLLNQTWSGAITLTAASTIWNNGNSTFKFTGPMDLGANQLTFQTDRDGSRIEGDISGAGGSLVKTGIRNLVLSGTNTYTGTTTVSNGTLQFASLVSLYNNNPADWTAANLIVAGTLALNVGGPGEFAATDVTTLLTNLGGANGTGTTGFAAGSAIGFDTSNAGGSFSIADIIADSTGTGGGALGLTKLGSGTLVLTNANTYTGPTTISAGTLRLENAAAVQNSASISFSGGILQVVNEPTFAASALTLSGGSVSSDRLDEGAGLTHNLGDVAVTNTTQTFTKGANVTSGDAAIQIGNVSNGAAADGTTTFNPTTANLIIAGGYTGTVNSGLNTLVFGGTAASNSMTGDITLGTWTQIDVTKSGASVWTLSGNHGALAGITTVNAGALITTTLNALPNNTAVTFNGGAIAARIGGAGWTTGEVDTLLSSAIKTAGQIGIDTTNGNLTQWTDFTTTNLGPLGIGKFGPGTLTLNSTLNDYTGTTLISQGTLAMTVDHTLSGDLAFGYANGTTSATGLLDLNAASATFGGLSVHGNSPGGYEVQIGSGEALAITGDVQIGAAPAAVGGTVNRLNLTGGGVFNVTTAAAGLFRFGANANTSISQDITLDLTALSAATIHTSTTGTIRINSGSGTNVAGTQATLLLPTPVVADTVPTATLTAGTLAVGNGGAFNSANGQINTLQLGTGLTTLNADTINVGTGLRDIGQIVFGGAGGDVIIRAADGSSRATALNVGAGGGNTGTTNATLKNLVDFSGHDADILVTSLGVGNQNRTSGMTYEFKFGEGDNSTASVLDATNVNIGFRTNSTNSTTSVLTSRVDLSGGTITFGDAGATGTGVDIGSSAYDKAGAAGTVGELNISGGSVTIHNGSGGFAVRLGSNVEAGGGTVTATMNLTGGTTTLTGDIVRGATSPRTTSTLRISGGTLDMGGNDIGSGTESVTLTAESGTLENVASINGNGGLEKTTGGTLVLDGINTYTGDTVVNEGTLELADDAQMKFVLGASTGINNKISGAGSVTLDGDFVIDTSAADGLFSGSWTLEDVASLTGAYGATFSIVGFTDIGNDQWEKDIGGGKKYTFDESTGVLTLASTGGPTYASWIDGFFSGESDPAIIGVNADPDDDGISNAVEMVIGGDPKDGMDTALLPTLEMLSADPDGDTNFSDYFLFTFRRTDESVTAGLTTACETDTDLAGPWITAVDGVDGVVILTDDNFTFTPPAATDTDRVRVYVPRGANPELFGRLTAQVP